jgi:hypothetical protein
VSTPRVIATSNLEEYQRNFEALTRALGNDMRAAIRKEGRLLFQTLGDVTPPDTFASGRKNVETQLRKAVRPLKLAEFPETVRSPLLRKLIRERDHARLQDKIDKMDGSPLQGLTLKPFDRTLHESVRNRRGGVSKDQKVATLDRAEWRTHLKRKQSHVGMAKGGWAAATIALGGRVRSFAMRWVSMGSFRDELSSLTDANVQATNNSPWADDGAETTAFRRAIRSRSASLKVALEAAMKGAAFKTLKA